jgi:hypothetical protein
LDHGLELDDPVERYKSALSKEISALEELRDLVAEWDALGRSRDRIERLDLAEKALREASRHSEAALLQLFLKQEYRNVQKGPRGT